MPCGREIRLRRVKSLRRWGIYFISLDAKHQISQFAEQIISPWAKRTISLFVKIKCFEYWTRSVSRGAEAPTEPAGETKSLCPCQKKALAFASAFFNEINPFRDFWNALRAWNTPAACEIAAAVRDLFHFTWCEASNFTICRANYFTVSEANDFTFCLDKTLWILGTERVKARSTALPAADEAVLRAGRHNEHCEAFHSPRLLHIILFRLWRKLIHYAPRPLPQKCEHFGIPPARQLCFWPKGSLVRVQHGAKIKNPVERRDFCFVLFNIYHSLNAHDSNEMHLSDIFEKFVLNEAQLNILMIRMCCLFSYVCL